METAPEFPGAEPPARSHRLRSLGLELRLHEWGDPGAPPLLLCHGMLDHARGFDTLAPRLAGRFRVLALDARGHGDSEWADAYAWSKDLVDIVNVLRWLGRPAHLVGHSRGGGQATDVATLAPELVRQLVNIDGFGPPAQGGTPPGVPRIEGTYPERFASFLDRRARREARAGRRPYAALDDLVDRRRAQNPRLSTEWLRYFVFHGARRDPDGWVWKADPIVSDFFGPWKVDWIAPLWSRLELPMLAVTGSEPDTWGLPQAILDERLADVRRLERAVVKDAGHFVAMERPAELADLLLGFLAR